MRRTRARALATHVSQRVQMTCLDLQQALKRLLLRGENWSIVAESERRVMGDAVEKVALLAKRRVLIERAEQSRPGIAGRRIDRRNALGLNRRCAAESCIVEYGEVLLDGTPCRTSAKTLRSFDIGLLVAR